MKYFIAMAFISLLCLVYVTSFECWMCRDGAASFDLCDQKKEKEDCKAMRRCGTFSYIWKGSRLFAKSCTTIPLCSENSTFCQKTGGGKDCRVQCCDTDLCNYQKGFAPTTPPIPFTHDTSTSSPASPRPTIKSEQTTTDVMKPTEDSQSDLDDEDCSWVDSA